MRSLTDPLVQKRLGAGQEVTFADGQTTFIAETPRRFVDESDTFNIPGVVCIYTPGAVAMEAISIRFTRDTVRRAGFTRPASAGVVLARRIGASRKRRGGMAEWPIAPVLKTGSLTASWVRIPVPPSARGAPAHRSMLSKPFVVTFVTPGAVAAIIAVTTDPA